MRWKSVDANTSAEIHCVGRAVFQLAREIVASNPDAFTAEEFGSRNVYVMSFRTPGEPVRISTLSGQAPRWGASAAELFYFQETTLMQARLRDWMESTNDPMPPGGSRRRRAG